MFACLFILFKEVFQKKLSSPQIFLGNYIPVDSKHQ